MTTWQKLQMRDLMVEFHDGPHATPQPADAGPVYLGIKNITDAGMLDLREVRHIAEQDFGKWTRRVRPQAGDVVFTYEATLHRYALIPEGFRGCLGRRLALIRTNEAVVLPRYLHLLMLGPLWRETVTDRIISGATVDRLPIIDFPNFPVSVPDMTTQHAVVGILGALDDLIENNRRRVELLEQMAQAIHQEWFVHFRFPGHEETTFVDSPLGALPEGWEIKRIAEIAGRERNAVTGGPFGSRLGRKDYVEAGVPVLRGANLRLHGGFDEADLVFVSNEKAEELRACLARRGDIVVTQRGTLGQVGYISDRCRFDRYLLSQSQMKITVDDAKVD
ncbi:MAG: restriction endonuclease subunit S, partial [Actinobacteria bacterium]|nr:restriction endonuclease subunit S [Actinomycetota bacterium]